jgi:hypothetical protein
MHSMTVINCEVDVYEADNGNEQNRRDIVKTMEGRCIGTYWYPGYLITGHNQAR